MDYMIYAFFIGLALVFASFLLFYLYQKKKYKIFSKAKTTVLINYGLSTAEQSKYIEAAKRCQKDNSPISGCPFHELFAEGSEILKRESFKINDNTFEGSGYHVI